MYDIALTVRACLQAGTSVDVAWVVGTDGPVPYDPGEALAITPGGGRVGSVLSGALDDQLADAATSARTGRVVDLDVNEVEALVAGLPRGGRARCVVVSADSLPEELWDRLVDRRPVCLVSTLDAGRLVETALYDAEQATKLGGEAARLIGAGRSATTLTDSEVVTVLWPVPRLVVVGGGAVVDAIVSAAQLLGWRTQSFDEPAAATANIVGLSALDKVVVAQHDVDAAGAALRSALSSRVGYIGALGGRRMQDARADWLRTRGIGDLSRINGPAGIDIGATTPAEIAVSILAEAIALQPASTPSASSPATAAT